MAFLHLTGLLLAVHASLLWTPSHGTGTFCVFRNTDLDTGASAVPFTGYIVNEDLAFDLDTNHFVVPQTGWYWLHWSVGMAEAAQVNVTLQGAPRSPYILRQNSSFVGTPITTSRDELVQLQAGTEIWLSSGSALFSNDFKQITFSGFDLSDVSTGGDTVAFSVGLSASLTNAGYEKIPYDVILADSHGGWNATNREYVVPQNGTYVITAVTGAIANDVFVHDLMVDDGSTIRQLVSSAYFYYTRHTGPDTISRTIITTLHAGERLFTQLYSPGYSVYSDANYVTSLMGFRYAPAANTVSWSVKRNTGVATGPEDPLMFNIVLNNQGGAWQEASGSTVLVPQAGIYYVHISAGVYDTAAKMDLMINGFPYANIHHESINDGFSTHSRAILLRLSQGDELHVRVPTGYTLVGLVDVETTFSGFLLK